MAERPRSVRPRQRAGHVAGGGEHPGPRGGDRLHVRGEVADVDPLGLLEQARPRSRRRPGPPAGAPSRPATGTGSAAGRPPRRARRPRAGGRPRRRGRRAPSATRLSATCMSATPRGGDGSRAASSRARSQVRWASPSRPWVISMSARVMVQPRTSATCPRAVQALGGDRGRRRVPRPGLPRSRTRARPGRMRRRW